VATANSLQLDAAQRRTSCSGLFFGQIFNFFQYFLLIKPRVFDVSLYWKSGDIVPVPLHL